MGLASDLLGFCKLGKVFCWWDGVRMVDGLFGLRRDVVVFEASTSRDFELRFKVQDRKMGLMIVIEAN